jgi:hypothetical protein
MARIKYVLNERRLAYEGALELHAEEVEAANARNAVKIEKPTQGRRVRRRSPASEVSPPAEEGATSAPAAEAEAAAPEPSMGETATPQPTEAQAAEEPAVTPGKETPESAVPAPKGGSFTPARPASRAKDLAAEGLFGKQK